MDPARYGEPLALVLLDVPWEDAYLTAGKHLLEDVLAHARMFGTEEIEHAKFA